MDMEKAAGQYDRLADLASVGKVVISKAGWLQYRRRLAPWAAGRQPFRARPCKLHLMFSLGTKNFSRGGAGRGVGTLLDSFVLAVRLCQLQQADGGVGRDLPCGPLVINQWKELPDHDYLGFDATLCAC